MACDATTLVESVAEFQGASERQLRLIKLALLVQWSATTSTLGELLASVSGFQGLSERQLQLVALSIYCQLAS